ncbi:MAG TPA: membrane protein insertase YidC [Bdellovibrionota bacterium]|nr:membrane protein insertase YidC [Bdellovibrionota bacterium]
MDRRTLLAITLCFAIFVFWQKFYLEPRIPAQQRMPHVTETAAAPQATATAPAAPSTPGPSSKALSQAPRTPAPVAQRTPELKNLPSATGEVTVTDGPYLISNWNLKNYRTGLAQTTATIDLASVTHQPGELTLAFDDPAYAYLSHVQGEFKAGPKGTLVWRYEDANVTLSREVTSSPDQPYLSARISAEFKDKRPAYAFLSIASQGIPEDPEEQDRQVLYYSNQSLERLLVSDAIETKEVSTPVKYIGAANRYFLLALLPEAGLEPKGLIQPGAQGGGKLSLVYPVSGNSITIPLKVYFGPKDLEVLRTVDPLLDHTVDFGWFTAFAYPLLKILRWFYKYVGNYGVAIILLTLLLKIVTYPLTYKSVKSMKEMAKIQPQLQKLREKYKNDKEALNREMLTMMRSHGYNPMAGCLPILVQMPIFFALYRVLYGSIELYHAPFALWIQDLSSKDPLYVTPVLLSITMYIQQKLTPTTGMDPAQAKMMQFMPLIFGAFMLTLPSGLTVYMLVNAIASIAQQIVLNKKFDTGHVTAFAKSR